MKTCGYCRTEKPHSEFYTSAKGKLSSYCRSCNTVRCNQYLQKHREKRNAYHREYSAVPENKARRVKVRKARTEASPRMVMQITLRHGLKRKTTENPATIDDLMRKWVDQDGRCALTGIKMTWAKGQVLPTSISLDRIDYRAGYSADNIRLICHAINAFRGRMTDGEMLAMAQALLDNAYYPRLKLVS